jgi:hypothetical protein
MEKFSKINKYSDNRYIQDEINIDKYKSNFQNKIQTQQTLEESKKYYNKIINVKGDGNCYYRAVFGSLLYSILYQSDMESRQKYLDHLIKIFKNFHEMVSFLEMLKNSNNTYDYDVFSIIFRDYDIMIIRTLRTFLYNNIINLYKKNNEFKSRTDISLLDTRYEGNAELFYYNVIYTIYDDNKGECAEGYFVEIGLLPRLIGSKSQIIIILGSKNTNRYTYSAKINKFKNNKLPPINIVYIPGHYQIIIPINLDIIIKYTNSLQNNNINNIEINNFSLKNTISNRELNKIILHRLNFNYKKNTYSNLFELFNLTEDQKIKINKLIELSKSNNLYINQSKRNKRSICNILNSIR